MNKKTKQKRKNQTKKQKNKTQLQLTKFKQINQKIIKELKQKEEQFYSFQILTQMGVRSARDG